MSLNLRVEYADSTTDTIEAATAHTIRDLSEQDRARATVYRSDWQAIEDAITARTAKLYVVVDGTDIFAGRLDKTDTREDTVTVAINSPEIDAAEAEPTGNNVIYQNTGDDVIATDQIQAVSTLSAGTVTQQAPSISYSVSYGSRSKILYDLRRMTGSEFRYNDDWTVDYVDRLGSDKSGSITLGPANQNVGDDFSKKLDVRQNVTHVRGLGAQQGPDQITATGVAPSYSSGRKIYKRYENKEIVEQSRLQEVVDQLVQEYDGEPRSLEIECTVYDEPLELGDTVQVTYPEENIDRTLRVVRLRDNYGTRGDTLEVTLANRTLTREQPEAKRNNDLQRFNRGYQGFLDRDQTTSGWNPAGDGVPQTLEIPNWPDDIVTEQTVELTVQGRAWRSPVSGEGHDHDVTISTTSGDNADFNDYEDSGIFGVSAKTTPHTFGTWTPSISASFLQARLRINVDTADNAVKANLYRDDTDLVDVDSTLTTDDGDAVDFVLYDWVDPAGHTYEVEVRDTGGGSTTFDAAVTYLTIGKHTHDVNSTETSNTASALVPGIVTEFNNTQYYPDHARIEVNGSPVSIPQTKRWVPLLQGDDETDWEVSGGGIKDPETDNIRFVVTVNDSANLQYIEDVGLSGIDQLDFVLEAPNVTTNDTTYIAVGPAGATPGGFTASKELDTSGGIAKGTYTLDVSGVSSAERILIYHEHIDDGEIFVYDVTTTPDLLEGDGAAKWQETIDLAGQLTSGGNTIAVTPTNQRGSLNLILFSELFRRGPKSN